MRDRLNYNLKPHESPLKKVRTHFDSPAGASDVSALVDAFCKYSGVRYAYPVISYSAALLVALYALGAGSGSSVALAAYNFPQVAGAVELMGARSVLIDVDPSGYTMNMSHLELSIGGNVRAVIASHMFGASCAIDSVMEASGIYKFGVIEDVNTSLGAVYKGFKCGNRGHISVFNFGATSLLDCGFGGMVATSNEKINARLKIIMNRGLDSDGDLKIPSPEFSMPAMMARDVNERLKYIDDFIEYKYMVAKSYRRELMYNQNVSIPEQNAFALNTFNYYPVYCKRPDVYSKLSRICSKHVLKTRNAPIFIPSSSYFKSNYSLDPGAFKGAQAAFSNSVFMPNDFSDPYEKIEEVIRDLKGL